MQFDRTPTRANEHTFFVAPEGNDEHPGTMEEPLATLAGARDRVRRVLDGEGDTTVYFRDGCYRFNETVVFDLRDSGSPAQRVTYRAYPGETPVFTSGVHVTGWRRIDAADPGYSFLPEGARRYVYVAEIPHGLRLIRNLVERSEPWLERARIDVTDLITTSHFKHCDMVESEKWDPPEEKQVQEYSRSMEGLSNDDSALDLRIYQTDYNMNLLPVATIRGNRLYTQVPGTYRLAPPPPHHRAWKGIFEMCWIENVLEGIDAPGKWACNTRTGRLYLWPKNGTTDIYAPSLVEFVRVEGDIDDTGPIDTPVRYLTFEGITFTNGERSPWEEGDSGVQHDWGMADKGNALLRFRGAEHCVVRDCTFAKSGGAGVRFDLHARHNVVENCLFEHLGHEAVQFCGYGIGSKDANQSNRFVGNEIHHIGRIKWDAPAIIVWNSGHNLIANNHLHHCPSKGVLLSAPRSRAFTKDAPMREQAWRMARWSEVGEEARAHVVRREARGKSRRVVDVDDQVCAPYRYLRGNVVERNTLHDMSESMWGDGIFYVTATGSCANEEDRNEIRDNYIYNCDGCSRDQQSGFFRGIYLDSFMGDFGVHRNVWYNCTMLFEANFLALWYGETCPRANLFYDVSHGSDECISGELAEPLGTLVFGASGEPTGEHDPRVEALEDYRRIYRGLDALPGVVEGTEQVKRALRGVIERLGDVTPG